MTRIILFLLLFVTNNNMAWSDARHHGLQVDVKRDGQMYSFNASFNTSLSTCAAYHYLTDYDAAKNMPGVIESSAHRQSANKVRVERTAEEHVLFFHVRLHSVMEYTEQPFDGIAFTQLTGDSKIFRGSWHIEPNLQGSTLRFKGLWEPDTMIPLFVIDHFARNGLVDRFNAIAELAEKHKDTQPNGCVG